MSRSTRSDIKLHLETRLNLPRRSVCRASVSSSAERGQHGLCPCGPLPLWTAASVRWAQRRRQSTGSWPFESADFVPPESARRGSKVFKKPRCADARCGARPGGALNTCGRLLSSPHRHQCSCCRHCTGVFSDLEAIRRSRRGPARMACGCRTLSHGGPGHLGLVGSTGGPGVDPQWTPRDDCPGTEGAPSR